MDLPTERAGDGSLDKSMRFTALQAASEARLGQC
jgi:hypothetical protein